MKSNHQLCPKCRAAMLERAIVASDTAEQAIARMRQFLASGGEMTLVASSPLASPVVIELVLPQGKADIITRAIDATGIHHHGEALVTICNAYLGK